MANIDGLKLDRVLSNDSGGGRDGLELSRSSSGSLLGYDLLRVLAMTPIVLQHVVPIYGFGLPRPYGLDLGQLGVTVYCALSGFFLLRSSRGSSESWLYTRLRRLMPAYWIALAGVFLLNAIAGYKPATVGLFLRQFAGVAHFTDREDLIGKPFWFISMIIVCYLVGAIIRRRPPLMFAAIAVCVMVQRYDPWTVTHLASYLSGAALTYSRARWFPLAVVLFFSLLVPTVNAFMAYPALSGMALVIADLARQQSPRLLRRWSEGTYQFYLVHGTVYLIFAQVLGLTMAINLLLGTAASFIAAGALRRIADPLGRWLETAAGKLADRIRRSRILAGPAIESERI